MSNENLADKPWMTAGGVKNEEWRGFKVYEFKIDEFTIQVAEPKTPIKGKPWIMSVGEIGDGFHWQMDEKLLNAGAYVVAINSYNVYGADYGLNLMDSLYRIVRHNFDLPEKCGLYGVSRAGLSVYRWAIRHPERVACIYCEGPVLDFKTWPMSWAPSADNWTELKRYYGFTSNSQAVAYTGNPIDNLETIAKAKIPIRHAICLTDEHDTKIVPNEKNTLKAQRYLQRMGHDMNIVIIPEGMKVPYAFDDESVEFMISNATPNRFSRMACAESEKPVRFAVVSDFHAPDLPDGKERMQAVVDAANKENVDFLIQLGDFIRLDSVSQPLITVWNGYTGEKYHVLGNHDLDQYSKEEFVEGFGMPGRYYSFDKGDFHFIVLDGNNLYDGEVYTPYRKANYYVDMAKRAFMDPEQLEWLRKDLGSTNKRCILFSHQSMDKAMGNREQVRRVLEEENAKAGFKKVVVAFSGHNHSNYSKEINGITYVQINSASYVWIGEPTKTEERYPEEINQKYSLLKNSMTYTKPLYGIVTVDKKGITMKGTEAEFMPPTPKDLNMPDEINTFPLVPFIKDLSVTFE